MFTHCQSQLQRQLSFTPQKLQVQKALLYSMLESHWQKASKIFERKDPHGYEKALCSIADSKESNMPNLLLSTI